VDVGFSLANEFSFGYQYWKRCKLTWCVAADLVDTRPAI
jgi:hypothetical protein